MEVRHDTHDARAKRRHQRGTRLTSAPCVAALAAVLLLGCRAGKPGGADAGAGDSAAAAGSGGMPSGGGPGAAGTGGRGSDPSAPKGGASGGTTSGTGGSSGVPDAAVDDVDGDVHGAFTEAELRDQGCDLERPAIFYAATTGDHTAAATPPASALAPVPCVHYTDLGSAEPSLGITSDGTVYLAPVFSDEGSGLIHTTDHGVTWEVTRPLFPNGGSHGRVQPYLYIDPATDRIFFSTSASAGIDSPATDGFNLSISDDGKTWDYVNLLPEAFDWMKIFAGPPVTSTTSGYPNVIYASAPAPISTPVPVADWVGLKPMTQPVYKSLDGGATWQKVAELSLLPEDVPDCVANEWVIYGSGVVGPDGVAYQVMRRCRQLVVSRSQDEGATWTLHAIPGGTMPPFDTSNLLQIVANPNILATELLTADEKGNLYVAWVDADGRLRMVTSRDSAETWSTPVTVSAPEIREARYAGVAARAPGTLAIVYYGSADGITYHGYLAETENAFDEAPLFWSVTANDPKDPLYKDGFEVGYLGILNGYDLNEIVHIKYAPDGDLWASFTKDMCKGVQTDDCQWDAGKHVNSAGQAVIGRMLHGVRSHFAQARPYAAPESCANDSSQQTMCVATASAEAICDELKTCACDHCACEFNHCQRYPACASVRQCATLNNCRGLDCLFSCSDISYQAGELMSSMALGVGSCLQANTCPDACP